MNSLYAPADSLKKVLHSVDMTNKVCTSCNESLEFNTSLRRWSSSQWNGYLCKGAN